MTEHIETLRELMTVPLTDEQCAAIGAAIDALAGQQQNEQALTDAYAARDVAWSEIEQLRQHIAELEHQCQAYRDALSPDRTKALLIGEFHDDAVGFKVCWSTVKDIQRAILERARLNAGWACRYCGSTTHILTIRDRGHLSCCHERELVPPGRSQEGGE